MKKILALFLLFSLLGEAAVFFPHEASATGGRIIRLMGVRLQGGVRLGGSSPGLPSGASGPAIGLFSNPSGDELPLVGVSTHQERANNVSTPTPDATNVALAQAAGASIARFDATWQEIEETPGVYDFSGLDPTVSAFRTAGFTVDLVLAYGNNNYTGSYFNAPIGPTNVGHFADFAAAVANHYGGSGFIYEVWNEPNLDWDWAQGANASDYAALLSATAAAIKGAQPAATVLGAGVSPGPGIAATTFIAGVASAGGFTADVDGISSHPYNTTFPEQQITDNSALISAEGGIGLPIYNTEWGYSQDWVGFSQETRAIYAARALLSSIISGVKTMTWYDLIDDTDDPEDHESNFGLNAFDFSSLPAAVAYRAISDAMAGTLTYNIEEIPSLSAYRITFNKSGGLTRVVWTTGSSVRYAEVEDPYSSIDAKDVFGNPVSLSVRQQTVSFVISAATGPVILTITP